MQPLPKLEVEAVMQQPFAEQPFADAAVDQQVGQGRHRLIEVEMLNAMR